MSNTESLVFLLYGDVKFPSAPGTEGSVTTTWQAIGRLGAIAGIRRIMKVARVELPGA